MAQIVEIENNKVRLVEHRTIKIMSLEDFKGNLFTSTGYTTPRMPVNTVFVLVSENNEAVGYVVERPPATVTMTINFNKESDQIEVQDPDTGEVYWEPNPDALTTKDYRVKVPWQYWTVVVGGTMIGQSPGRVPQWNVKAVYYNWSDEQIESPVERVYAATLPNMRGADYVCMGRTDYETDTLDGMIDTIVDTWWHVPFNDDLSYEPPYPHNTFEDWEASDETAVADQQGSSTTFKSLVEKASNMTVPGAIMAIRTDGVYGWRYNPVIMSEYLEGIDPALIGDMYAALDRVVTKREEEARERNDKYAFMNSQAYIDNYRDMKRAMERIKRQRAINNAGTPTEDAELARMTTRI